MSLFRGNGGEKGANLKGDRILLRSPVMADYRQWAHVREESRAFLTPWEPAWSADDLTRTAFKRRVHLYQREAREDKGKAFFLFRQADGELLGGVTLSRIERGVKQSCALGYWMGEKFAGSGYMLEAVRLIIPYAFETLHLHRIEAASMPHNKRSIHLLEKIGFKQEGRARSYLQINGVWQDHLLYAMVVGDEPLPKRAP